MKRKENEEQCVVLLLLLLFKKAHNQIKELTRLSKIKWLFLCQKVRQVIKKVIHKTGA